MIFDCQQQKQTVVIYIAVKQLLQTMKPKKSKQDKVVQQIRIPQKNRSQITSGRTTLTKRKEGKANKQNQIRLTESLENNTVPSKQFTLSEAAPKDISSRANRIDLQQIKQNNNDFQRSTLYNKSKEKIPEQQLFQRRLSLKCTNNYSQQLQNPRQARYSMIPLRKENSAFIPTSKKHDQKESLYTYEPSIATTQAKQKPSFKKEVIITNLMAKLDHQEDLRSIIQSKLKAGSSQSNFFGRERKNQGYLQLTEDSTLMNSKLKQCENELTHFKSVIKQMSQRLYQLTPQKKEVSKQRRHQEESTKNDNQTFKNDLTLLIKLLSQNTSICQNCLKPPKKNVKQIGIQTTPFQNDNSAKKGKLYESNDFFDNIQRTLKVLSNND